jgi:hypothetical protein
MALRRRIPGGGAPGQDEPITGESQFPGVRDTREGLGGAADNPFASPDPQSGGADSGKDKLGPVFGRFGESPRERPVPNHQPPPPAAPTEGAVPTPHYPTPMSGGTSMAGGGGSTDQGPSMPTFDPMPSAPMGAMTSARRSLYGKAGGLLGGGLGAQDTTSNQMSDPISSLIAMLQKQNGGF